MRISVIIPTLNEGDTLAECLAALRAKALHEIIVVDGGSTDATLERASKADLVLDGPRGRAAQMNAGAAPATGEILLFLHADCRLETGCLQSVQRLLSGSRIVAGCFQMRVQAEGFLYRMIDACTTARVRLSGIIYGDQGLFLRRDRFETVGGFPSLRLMEDVFISLKLRRLGRIEVSKKVIHVSPRRWQKQGIVRQSLRNWTLTALAAAGVHPDQLARFYPTVR